MTYSLRSVRSPGNPQRLASAFGRNGLMVPAALLAFRRIGQGHKARSGKNSVRLSPSPSFLRPGCELQVERLTPKGLRFCAYAGMMALP